jgi:hypothetical protein
MSNGFYKPVFNPTSNLEMEIFRGQHMEYLVSDLLLLVTIAPLRKLLSEWERSEFGRFQLSWRGKKLEQSC